MTKHTRIPVYWLLMLSLSLVVLAACGGSTESVETLPIVNDPDLEINVTPQEEGKYGYFTIVVQRVGKQAPSIGWFANGEVYVRVSMDLDPNEADDVMLASGTGFGKAGFDASNEVCTDLGGWPTEYNAEGVFDVRKCELSLMIEETWPKTEAHASCLGVSGSGSGGVYKLTFPGLKFTADDPREDTETSENMITWLNTFTLFAREGLEDSGCEFVNPTP